ncbi:hypothetical protein BJ684DRAFT_20698 [Piptocephalis cylindrospora]|uniref:protein disulfide-isomerase n=1 Tax=Piptocephalis cylindrospora TaxID=1907219 RepID=A0A4P9Y4K9_9FUNG|nr:hypothetical protein BJ684DRAFT_20698 [Piptocephalis cylindrospora]|eukprot:RKP12780.1 hypothetical protein BJ684DRAFT_20698 [Piptocephalis cylindrospora]
MKFIYATALLLLALQTGPAQALYDPAFSTVETITADQFHSKLKKSPRVTVLEFFAPWCGHCQSLVPHYSRAAKSLNGLVDFMAIDCDVVSNQPVCTSEGVKGFPMIKLYYPKHDKIDPTKFKKISVEFQGIREAKELVQWATNQIPDRIIKITSRPESSAVAKTLNDFYAQSNDTLPKVILFTDKPKTTTLYKAMALEFHGRMGFAEAKGKVIAEQANVKSFPTLWVLPAASSGKEGVEDTSAIPYDGPLKREDLKAFIEEHALPAPATQPKAKAPAPAPEPERTPLDPEIQQLSTQSDLDSLCPEKRHLCLLAILDPEAEDHEDNLVTLREVKAQDYERKGKYKFAWVPGPMAKSIVQTLDMSVDTYPSLAILSPSRHLYRSFLGAFETKSVDRFLQDTANGKARTFGYSGDLKLDLDESRKEEEEEEEGKEEEKEKEEKKEEKEKSGKHDEL